jgi:inner membrane protein
VASLITNPVVPLTIVAIVGRRVVPWPLLALGVVLSVLPDVDAVGFRLGIPYASPFGHRGFTHSIAFAALAAALFIPFARPLGATRITTFVFLSVWIPLTAVGVVAYCARKFAGRSNPPRTSLT